ncbi:MAG: transposase [Lachnospiraceae bacterium]|nr:transposase [Lachnospiraceae bacterium]
MPRTARSASSTGIYHVMIRGNNKQDIFVDDFDHEFFLKVLRECKDSLGFELFAYCLMPNHVHLLIRSATESLARIFMKIGTRYATWFNRKHGRVGHLFQDRFRSENVETDQYFLTVLRYIIRNPLKAGLESEPGYYRWNCYDDYRLSTTDSLIDRDFAFELAGSFDTLMEYIQQQSTDSVMDVDEKDMTLPDDRAFEMMREIANCTSASQFGRLDRTLRKNHISKMLDYGMTIGQISAFTGSSLSTVYRIKNEKSEPSLILKK